MTSMSLTTPKKRAEHKKPGLIGNRNTIRHGLTSGQLPKDCKYIELRLNSFRRTLEDTIVDARGEVTITDACNIQTAMRWERHAALAQRWLTKDYNNMKPERRLHFSREIAKASAERDKAINILKLDRDSRDDVIDVLYSRVTDERTEPTEAS